MDEGCPDPETIAAYLDRTLPETERARVTEHLASCETCYFVFSESVQTHVTAALKEETAAPHKAALVFGRWSKRAVWSAAAAAAATAAAVVLVVQQGIFSTGRRSTELEALVAAVGTDRPFEPRLTGGFAYGPVRAPVRGTEMAMLPPDLRIAVAGIEKKAASRATARNLHELGVAYLTTGEIRRAISTLDELSTRTRDAKALNDLAAAYLVRGTRDSEPQDVSRALALANAALATDRLMPEALFNRALALERLSMFGDAREAWRTYLSIDSDSGWGAEARNHLQQLGGA
jgi:tetratricopeptide (TPR) repeat protein